MANTNKIPTDIREKINCYLAFMLLATEYALISQNLYTKIVHSETLPLVNNNNLLGTVVAREE